MKKRQPAVGSLPMIGHKLLQTYFHDQDICGTCVALESGFDERCRLLMENDVVIVDNSCQPSTAGRSVEVKRNDSVEAVSVKQKRCMIDEFPYAISHLMADRRSLSVATRNRLFDPLASLASRLQRDKQREQIRFPGKELETKNLEMIPSLFRSEPLDTTVLKKRREVVVCASSNISSKSTRKPIVYESCDIRSSPSPRKSVSKKGLDIVIRRDFQDIRVVNPPTRKRVLPSLETPKPGDSLAAPHIYKSETLTVIIPKRRAVLLKQSSAIKPSAFSVEVTSEQRSEAKSELNKDSSKNAIIIKSSSRNRAVIEEKKSDDVKELALPDIYMQDLSNDYVNIDDIELDEKLASGGNFVEDDDPFIVDDSYEDEEVTFLDPPVLKSLVSEETIIPFSSDKFVFSNHFPCRRLIIHGKRFTSTEQYYMWSKAKFCRDYSAANAILYLNDPKMIKQVGSQLVNFDQKRWKHFAWRVMMKAVMAKFKLDRRMRYQLFRTAGSLLVEASPHDSYWGIGLSIDDPNVADPTHWKGLNIMGEVLMQIRDVLLESPLYSEEVNKAKENLLAVS